MGEESEGFHDPFSQYAFEVKNNQKPGFKNKQAATKLQDKVISITNGIKSKCNGKKKLNSLKHIDQEEKSKEKIIE